MTTEFTQEKNTWAFVREFKFIEDLAASEAEFEESPKDSQYSEEFRQRAADLVSPFDWRVKKGEIRLLSQTDNITYGVVLPWDWNHSLFVPFSHASHPASDQELYSEDQDRGAFQQVFQLWNARTVNNTLLAKTWLVDEISEVDTKRLNQFFKHIWLGEELPAEIKNLTGLPLQTEDIRRKFIMRELENFAEFDAEDNAIDLLQEEFSGEQTPCFQFLKTHAGQELQAAAGKNKLSCLYAYNGSELEFIDGIELEAFEKVDAGKSLPGFTWFTEKLPSGCQKWQGVFMVHCQSGTLLGSGLIIPVKGGYEFNMIYDCGTSDTPEIRTPADIQLIVRKD